MFPKQFLYPILTAVAIVLLVNVIVFPEFGSTYLGTTTIETLQKTVEVQKSASALFVAYASSSKPSSGASSTVESKSNDTLLKELTASKAELRKKVAGCKAALVECSFELAFSVLAPWELKPIASKGIKKLVSNTVSLVGACESEYALLGRPREEKEREVGAKEKEVELGESSRRDGVKAGKSGKKKSLEALTEDVDIDMLRPRREIEGGDEQLLLYLLRRYGCIE